ncbi:hypothetical protein K0504_00185 [Neiella marina]|uniref:MSHA biogenesis protein MshK n=1 Tax=Neiella holothuriorum TaxID=2870530 RepID=A0ABS7EAV0_9GAMM|nr:hypothetical protein [Neiella holothuriorum]MBW8189436.1 hypothetical protein [Neiella holothuriorum]
MIVTASLMLLSTNLTAEQTKLVDPTRPANYQRSASANDGFSALKLQQVVASSTRKFAVIDGQKVTAGQQVGEYKIIDIQPKHVVLQQSDGSQVTLTLFTNIKQQ